MKKTLKEKRNFWRKLNYLSFIFALLIWAYMFYLIITHHQISEFRYPFFGFIIFGLIYSLIHRHYAILNSGYKGEKETNQILSHLTHEYNVYTNVPLEIDNQKCELDFLIISHHGLTIIEVKNHNGSIEGNEDDYQWTQHKIGQRGTPYSSKFKNPVKQLKREIYILSKYLKMHHLNIYINGYVYFSTASNIKTNSQVVTNNEQDLIKLIKQSNTPISQDNLKKLEHLLMTYKIK